jgi:DNA-binding NtrC family response regulator
MNETEPAVLVLDDDESIRSSLAAYFEDRGWVVFEATDGRDALRLLETRPISAAIVDIRMGGITGDAFIRESVKRNLDLVFLICTGSIEYKIPPDLLRFPLICNRIFQKPLLDIAEMELEMKRLLAAKLNS